MKANFYSSFFIALLMSQVLIAGHVDSKLTSDSESFILLTTFSKLDTNYPSKKTFIAKSMFGSVCFLGGGIFFVVIPSLVTNYCVASTNCTLLGSCLYILPAAIASGSLWYQCSNAKKYNQEKCLAEEREKIAKFLRYLGCRLQKVSEADNSSFEQTDEYKEILSILGNTPLDVIKPIITSGVSAGHFVTHQELELPSESCLFLGCWGNFKLSELLQEACHMAKNSTEFLQRAKSNQETLCRLLENRQSLKVSMP